MFNSYSDDHQRPYLVTPWKEGTNYINAVYVHVSTDVNMESAESLINGVVFATREALFYTASLRSQIIAQTSSTISSVAPAKLDCTSNVGLCRTMLARLESSYVS